MTKSCVSCGTSFKTKPSHFTRRKFCSLECKGRSQLKGTEPTYRTIHQWLYLRIKKERCAKCGAQDRMLQIACKRGRYVKDVNEFFVLCVPCHVRYDMKPDTALKQSLVRKGRIPWNKGTKGVMKANSGSFKLGQPSPRKGKKYLHKSEEFKSSS